MREEKREVARDVGKFIAQTTLSEITGEMIDRGKKSIPNSVGCGR
jgi:hypothetical protein